MGDRVERGAGGGGWAPYPDIAFGGDHLGGEGGLIRPVVHWRWTFQTPCSPPGSSDLTIGS